MNDFYETIVIGAGISGIAAGRFLHKKQINYVILEAQQKIGGRIQTIKIGDVEVDIGAYEVPSFNYLNPIYNLMKSMKWPINSLSPATKTYYYDQFQGEINKQTQTKIKNIFNDLIEKVHLNSNKSQISLRQAFDKEISSYQNSLSAKELRLIYLFMNMIEQQEASTIDNLSHLVLGFQGEEPQDRDNYPLPKFTYGKLVKKIAQGLNIKINSRVQEIDYRKDKIIVTCQQKTLKCRNIICSIPLSHLKLNKVTFLPQLNHNRKQFIHNMGFGLMNKIILSFEEPFWPPDSRRIKFSCQERGKYSHFINLSQHNNHILCCFITDIFAQKLSHFSDEEIFTQTIQFLKSFFGEKVKFKQGYFTRWQKSYSIGSFSYISKNIKIKDIKQFRQSIENKIWFVGQYLAYENMGTAHGAYITGLNAAQEVYDTLRKKIILNNEASYFD